MDIKTTSPQVKSSRLEFYLENWKRLRTAKIKCAQWSDLELEIANIRVSGINDGFLGIKNDVYCYVSKKEGK